MSVKRRIRAGRARMGVTLLVSAAVMGLTAPIAAQAQEGAGKQQSGREVRVNIPPQALDSALTALADQAGLKILFSSGDVAGLRSAGLSGSFAPAEALSNLLAGSGFTFRFVGANAVTLERAPQGADGAVQLGPVRVESAGSVQAAGTALSNPNLVTEGTGSYTTRAITIGSNVPRSLRETPATVTVLSRERIEDSAEYELEDLLRQTPGITISAYTSRETSIQSRGAALQDIRVDGSPITGDGWTFFDLSHYDHVEVLRGVDGLFGSSGQPGGSLNLSRKRALNTSQYSAALSAGSWNNFRVEGDITGPLNTDGTLRGRLVAAYHDRDFHYRGSSKSILSFYGRLEWDATPTTLLALGAAYETRDEDGYNSAGLMRYQTGESLGLPRDTAFTPDWSYWNDEIREVFVRLEQKIGGNWRLNANLTHRDVWREVYDGNVRGGVAPDTGLGPTLGYSAFILDPGRGYTADATVSGDFELFGQTHKLLFGGEYQKQTVKHFYPTNPLNTYPAVDIYNFDPGAYTGYEPVHGNSFARLNNGDTVEYAAFASVQLDLSKRLHAILGARYINMKSTSLTYSLDQASGDFVQSGSWNMAGDALTPNAAVVWDFADTLSLYGTYSKTREFPGGVTITGDFLPPISGRNLEIGIKGEFYDGRLNASLSAYQIDRTGVPIYVGFVNGLYVYEPGGAQRSKGIEFDISGEILPGLQIVGGYTYNHNHNFDDDQQWNTATPAHILRLWASYAATEKLELSGGVNWQSDNYVRGSVSIYDQSTTPWTIIREENFNYTQNAYAVVNARISYAVTPKITASLNANNIFDKTYYSTVGSSAGGNFYGEPRNVMLTVRAKY